MVSGRRPIVTPKMLAQPNELKQLTGSMRELERRMNKSRRTNREARDQKNELLDQIRRLKVDANDFEKGLDIKNSKKYTTKESLFAAKNVEVTPKHTMRHVVYATSTV